jgi:general secretion pathway protein I
LREIVAQNMAAEILTDPAPPAIGDASGTIRNAGRQFAWTRTSRRGRTSACCRSR